MAEQVSPGIKNAVADYEAGMSRFLGLTRAEATVLGQRYQRGLQAFKSSLDIQAESEGLIPKPRGKR